MFLRTTRPAKQVRRQQTLNRHHRQNMQQLLIAPGQLAQFLLHLGEEVLLAIDSEVLYCTAKGHRHLGLLVSPRYHNPGYRSRHSGPLPTLLMPLIRYAYAPQRTEASGPLYPSIIP